MIKNFKKISLLASVFMTGCAVLVIEIVAIRILSPYYGNTIYAASSVIGTILAALSLGYYLGGKLADKYPLPQLFYGIICAAGFLVIGIQLLSFSLLPALGLLLTVTEGPLISSLILFFIPGFCLGTLSPFAIKLANSNNANTIGSQSGEIFFWSTVGSITGSLLSGFFLIPNFGINNIMIGTGCVLALWGAAGMAAYKLKRVSLVIVLLFFASTTISLAYVHPPKDYQTVLYEKDGVYEKIKITEGNWNGQPTRFLFQDRSFSAAMYINSDQLVYDYTKYYALYKLIKPEATQALVIGGGAYSIPKAFLADSPAMQVDVAEIEERLYSLAQTYFNLTPTPRLQNYADDGRQLLARNNKQYDTIISDVYYSLFSIPPQFTTKEFFELAKSRLSENGVFVGNFAGYLDQSPETSFITSEMATFKTVFPNSYFFAVNSPNSLKPQNIIFMGINGSKTINFASPTVTANKDPILKNLPSKIIETTPLNLETRQQLTDNYAPVEYLVSKVIDHWR